MRIILKFKKKGNENRQYFLYQFNNFYGALVGKNIKEDPFNVPITIAIIKFDPESENGFKIVTEKDEEIFLEEDFTERMKRFDTLINSMKLKVILKNFNDEKFFNSMNDFIENENNQKTFIPKKKRENNQRAFISEKKENVEVKKFSFIDI